MSLHSEALSHHVSEALPDLNDGFVDMNDKPGDSYQRFPLSPVPRGTLPKTRDGMGGRHTMRGEDRAGGDLENDPEGYELVKGPNLDRDVERRASRDLTDPSRGGPGPANLTSSNLERHSRSQRELPQPQIRKTFPEPGGGGARARRRFSQPVAPANRGATGDPVGPPASYMEMAESFRIIPGQEPTQRFDDAGDWNNRDTVESPNARREIYERDNMSPRPQHPHQYSVPAATEPIGPFDMSTRERTLKRTAVAPAGRRRASVFSVTSESRPGAQPAEQIKTKYSELSRTMLLQIITNLEKEVQQERQLRQLMFSRAKPESPRRPLVLDTSVPLTVTAVVGETVPDDPQPILNPNPDVRNPNPAALAAHEAASQDPPSASRPPPPELRAPPPESRAAEREFFYLTALSVKLKLASEHCVEPTVGTPNDVLFGQATQARIPFTEFYDFCLNSQAGVFEHCGSKRGKRPRRLKRPQREAGT